MPLIAVIGSVIGCSATSHRMIEEVEAKITTNDAELIYSGEITHDANARLFTLAASRTEKPTTLVITSNGGDVEAGIELGTWVFESGMNVRVSEFCVSSCANYVFVAGANKILEPTAMLAWHGGATQEFGFDCKDVIWQGSAQDCDDEELRSVLTDRLGELRDLESDFFERIGVDQKITVLGQQPEYDCRADAGYLGWYYSLEDLESLGVDGIVVLGNAWHPVTPSPDIRICRVDLGRADDIKARRSAAAESERCARGRGGSDSR